PANAQIAGYFVRQRPEWDKRAPWTPWKEVDAASYDDIVKIIATGEAYCGWFYDNRILYTAPPAPAVPEEMKRDPDADVFDPGFMNGWNACRVAMLAQPVNQGYKLPEGWKLVPVEPTAEMINAALASGALSIRSAYRLMLAAAPEGGNDHDTRR
ncbi:hypothetical protein ACTVNB_25520, partial [Serratia nematodiphila]